MKKVCVITGTRAEYGVIRPLLESLRKNPGLRLQLVVTGMHLLKDFGETITQIFEDGFEISARVKMFVSNKEGPLEASLAMAKAISGFAHTFVKLKPDILLLEGDRLEMLAAAVASLPFHIPIVHISGGDVSGGLDDSIRHALTRLAHIHLANTKASHQRILNMGEEPWRAKNVGTLAVSKAILNRAFSRQDLVKFLGLDPVRPYLLVVQHPISYESVTVPAQIKATIDAIKALKMQTIIMYPNNDLGSPVIVREIQKLKTLPFVRIFKNIPRDAYLGLLKYAAVLIGNSSSGIVESPFFGTPVINIGNRQASRERAKNIVDVGYSKNAIIRALRKFKRKGFRRIQSGNPYRDLNTQKRIVDILASLKIDPKLLNKRLML